MRICRLNGGWTLEKWNSLNPDEQDMWIAYEEDRVKKISKLRDWLTHTKDDGTSSIDGTSYALLRLLGDLV